MVNRHRNLSGYVSVLMVFQVASGTSFVIHWYKRPLDSYAYPDQTRGKRAKLTSILTCKKNQTTCYFLGKGAACFKSCLYRRKKSPFLWTRHSYMKTWIKLETTYKPPQGPHLFREMPFVTFEQANAEAIGNNHTLLDLVFSVSSYILVLRFKI